MAELRQFNSFSEATEAMGTLPRRLYQVCAVMAFQVKGAADLEHVAQRIRGHFDDGTWATAELVYATFDDLESLGWLRRRDDGIELAVTFTLSPELIEAARRYRERGSSDTEDTHAT